jgi:integrase
MATLYIQKNTNVKTGWRLMEQTYQSGKAVQKAVPRTAWPTLGFTDSMSLDEAKSRVKELNARNTIQRLEQSKTVAIANRIERDRLHHSAFVPKSLNEAFLKWLDDNVSGSESHIERMRHMWETAKKISISLQITPENYGANKKRIYSYFVSQEYSLDYTKKVIRVMNLYGEFASRLIGKYFDKISYPKGHDRERINDAYQDSEGYYGPSEPLSPSLLADLQDNLKPDQYEWLYLSLWLGLRPSEVDRLSPDKQRSYWRLEPGQPDVLWVYQPKLTSKPRPQRWKPIPIIFPEQQQAIEFIHNWRATPPLTKTLKRIAGCQLGLYAGRKGFLDLMLERGQLFENVSQWLGHSSLDMTWNRYKDKRRVGFTITG